MNIYVDPMPDGRKMRGKTFTLLLSRLEPLEEEPVPHAPKPQDPKDRVTVTVEPVAIEGPKTSAFAVYRVVRTWRGRKRVIAQFVADPTDSDSARDAAKHARQFATETLAQIEWEAT